MNRNQGRIEAHWVALALFPLMVAGCSSEITGGGAGGNGGGNTRPPPQVEPGVRCDDERPGPRQLRLLTRREYENTVRDLVGLAVDTSGLPAEPRVKGFDNNASAMVVTSRHLDAYLTLAETIAQLAVTVQRGRVLGCDPGAPDCARGFVVDFGLRAFRRPLQPEEIDVYLAAFDGASFDEGMNQAVAAMLISPSFLYRWEVGQASGNVATLTAYETASALSYLYWGTMPDEALFAAAAAGELATPEQLAAQARRLLADPRARVQVAEFAAQWLRTDGLTANKDLAIYPAFTDQVRQAMAEEVGRFVNHVVFDARGSFKDLLVADYVVANGTLAQFYGLPSQGGEFAEIPVTPASGRGGLLGLGAVLASHAHSNESSPIKRGVFVRSRFLCQDLPPPPPDLDATPPGLDPTLTTRDRFAQHTADPACASCHQYIDGVGFGFEGFDGVGGRRFEENGLPIDMSGHVAGIEGLGSGINADFDDVPQLASLLAESETAQSCLPRQYFRFARGYEETAYDACAVHNLALDFAESDLSVQELLVAITALPTFTQRAAN